MRREIHAVADRAREQVCRDAGADPDDVQRAWMTAAVLDEAFGLGPIERLLQSPCDAIIIRGPREVWIEQDGRHCETAAVFADEEHVQRTLQRHAPLRDYVRPADGDGTSLRLDVCQLRQRLSERAPQHVPAKSPGGRPDRASRKSFWA